MENQEIKSKWDDLARQIGAELSPEAEQRAETHTAATESASPSSSSDPPVRAPLPKKPAADWAGLAGELGLPPIEEEPVPAETPAPKPPRREEVREPNTRESHGRESHGRETHPRQPQPHDSRQRDREQREQSPPESRGPRRGRRGGRGRGEGREVERGGGESSGQRRDHHGQRRNREEERSDTREHGRGRSDKRRDAPEPRREQPIPQDFESDEFVEPVIEPSPVEEASSPPAEREPPAKSPAVSLWHKIFGAPAEPVAKSVGTSAEPVSEVTDPRLSYEPDEDSGRSEIRSLSGADVTAAEFVEEAIERPTLAEDEDDADRKRGRSRRRRRGGRGRRSRGDQREGGPAEPRIHDSGGDDQLDADFDDLGDDDSELTDDASLATAEPDHDDSDLEDSAGEQVASSSRSLSAAQRAIPSWDDAIGFIVEANMQTRSQRRPPSRPDSRGGSSRGRSRGRRK
jgi:ribonuclease E